MKRQMCFWMALAVLLMAPIPEPVAAQQVVKKGGQASQLPDKTVKKRYSRGIRDDAPSAAASVPAATLRWEPVVGMDAQLFPSFIVSTATMRLPQEDDAVEDPHRLGETLGFVGASLEGVPANSRLRIEAKANAVMEASVFEGRAAAGAGEYEVYPKINYKYDALLDWRQPMPLNITMEVFVDGLSIGTQSKTVTVRSINDCPFVVVAEDKNGEEDLDLSWMFAAYVNENHPFVDTLTREALESKIVEAFSGYQGENPAEVLGQVYAIWHTLQRRGMRYSDISQSSAESPVVISQHVRLFDEALAARQANCVDGTAVLAAVLRKIGVEPYLVLIPGHMFLAFDLDQDGETTLGLETTMMGDTAPQEATRNLRIPAALVERFKNQASFKSFSAAIAEGTRQLEKFTSQFDSDDPDYQLISVSQARKLGILPLAYRKAGGGGPGPLHGREGRGSGSPGGAGARCREYESRNEHRNDAAHVFKSDVQTTSVR